MLLTNVAGTYLGDPALGAPVRRARRARCVRVRPPGVPAAPAAAPPPRVALRVPVRDRPRGDQPHLQRHPGAPPDDPLPALSPRRSRAVPGAPDRVAGRPRARAGRARRRPARSPTCERLYYDTGLANNAPGAGRHARRSPTLEHIVFGTDWPYAALPLDAHDPAPALDEFGAEGRSAVESLNAHALVPRLAPAHTA